LIFFIGTNLQSARKKNYLPQLTKFTGAGVYTNKARGRRGSSWPWAVLLNADSASRHAVVREQGIPFSLKIDPFYSDFNQAILHQTIAAYESGQSTPVIKSMKELEEMTENE
jgi:hypothetical protein